ncbi:hypothetical protein A3D77_02485 [Candidatus Gottesmanbacteria bacterium RIFCSPHIGHO2_02_FULL_39_11]|uniref:Glycosyl transferase family 11 n=1 Tax=Candidatus Gottesmanbacteria bacterium RIFCSPHIGHO2_02_FULL_39_11 TaxID=1798382 RepID=A0A1F5ZVY5_9BACT|nr:MAG: hypothetical protein A3D77_02485 [Candidatus Gottesmanbacteria bacterium RIFCSPHIGHO2_02_FULL_39_11]
MIIIRITGGLGNQLFQYAAGRMLSIKFGTSLKLDITELQRKTYRIFLLDKFNIQAEISKGSDLKKYLKFSRFFPQDYHPYIHHILFPLFSNIYYEKSFHYDRSFERIRDNSYLIGYFQSEKYFLSIANILRRELRLNEKLSSESKELREYISDVNSISINIRRGDYVTNHIISRRHGFIGADYIHQAVSVIRKRVKNPHFFLFSDDIEWVKNNIILSYPATYVDINYPDRVEEDLILGSLCKHHILTNSTFSWWVGWLNPNASSIVIAPRNWFYKLKVSTKDLFPSSWIQI